MTASVPSARPARRPQGPAPARPQLRVVESGQDAARRRRRRARRRALVVVAVVAAGLFGLVVSHVVLTQGQFRLEHLQARAALEQARYERLRLQVAELESPARIVAAAQERLRMVPPPGVTYLSPSGPSSGRTATRAADGGVAGRRSAEAAVGGTPGTEDWSRVKRQLASRR